MQFKPTALLTALASASMVMAVDLVFWGSAGCTGEHLAGPFHFADQTFDKCFNLGTLITPLPQFIAFNNSEHQIQFTVANPAGCALAPAVVAPHGVGCAEAPQGGAWEFMSFFSQ